MYYAPYKHIKQVLTPIVSLNDCHKQFLYNNITFQNLYFHFIAGTFFIFFMKLKHLQCSGCRFYYVKSLIKSLEN